ncbi:MAG TPA: septal ring lytic transglycosylase RlpA family protein [Candidatus Limnocylindrales bacterium]
MRPRRVVVGLALIAVLTSVVVPVVAGSHPSGREQAVADAAFQPVVLAPDRGTSTAILPDSFARSAGPLALDGQLRDPEWFADAVVPPDRPSGVEPAAVPIVSQLWKRDPNISWNGPGFYGNAGACGMLGSAGLTPDTIGVAHRTLPCGTKVTFKWNGKVVVARVIDRGPYVSGRIFDMTHGLCAALNHCFTGWIWYHIG